MKVGSTIPVANQLDFYDLPNIERALWDTFSRSTLSSDFDVLDAKERHELMRIMQGIIQLVRVYKLVLPG